MGTHVSIPEKIHSASRCQFGRVSHAINEGEAGTKEKKKKGSKFATLRRKLTRSSRQCKSPDHAKVMREMLSVWPVEHVKVLVQEYEMSAAIKDLSVAAAMARPAAHSLRHDLSRLYESKFCTDVDLIFKNSRFPVHRAILSARSPYLRKLLSQRSEYGAQIHIKLKTPGVDVGLFDSLLKYLYSDDLIKGLENMELLSQLAGEFGVPNALEHDMKWLLDTGELSDAVLVFSVDSQSDSSHHLTSGPGQPVTQSSHIPNRTSRFEFPCHKAIIASRSPFFRNLINRRVKSSEESASERTTRTPLRIILDESVIPRRYARVLLSALYQDTVDMGCVLRGSPSISSLSEIQAMVSTGRCQMTVADEAMELYQIGQFLETQIISQGCEDIIADNLTSESLITVLNWSAEAHGSQWVHRQAVAFFIEDFIQIAHSPVLYDLSQDYLKEALSSDNLQVSELEVLTCVIKWGEHQLMKRIEEREPNLLSHTVHSVTKKGVRKKDLSDSELGDLLSEILPLVRIEHMLPPVNDVLNSAVKRGLLEAPAIDCENQDEVLHRIGAWTGVTRSGAFVKPRLFLPYYEEAKNVLEELMLQGSDSSNKIRALHLSAIPDTLYMLEERDVALSLPYSGSPVSTVDVITGSIPLPDRATFSKMLERKQELLQSKTVQRTSSSSCIDKRAVNRSVMLHIHLRVVREFGLPDSAIEVLQNSQYYYTDSSGKQQQQQPRHHHHHHHHHPQFVSRRRSSDDIVSPAMPFRDLERSSCLETARCDIMPDIAMATTTIQIHMCDEDLNLDVRKGSKGHGTLYV